MAKQRTIAGRKTQEHEEYQSHPGRHLIGELLHAHLALVNLFSREVGITPARLKLLHELFHAGPQGIGLNELALRLTVTPALVTRQVKELEREGWVQRRSDSRDRRRSFIYLSPQGEIEALELRMRARRFEAALLADMNQEEVAVATRVLLNLCERLESWRRKSILNRDRTNDAGTFG